LKATESNGTACGFEGNAEVAKLGINSYNFLNDKFLVRDAKNNDFTIVIDNTDVGSVQLGRPLELEVALNTIYITG